MNGWLENLELAFPTEPLTLREWLPILDAGLASLTVGVIPPALDQVLIGAIDRSRNPDIKLALVLGMNETVFPAQPELPALDNASVTVQQAAANSCCGREIDAQSEDRPGRTHEASRFDLDGQPRSARGTDRRKERHAGPLEKLRLG